MGVIYIELMIEWALYLCQGHLQGSGNLKRGGVLAETGWMPLIEWGLRGENWWT
jgi:hypothetical protein